MRDTKLSQFGGANSVKFSRENHGSEKEQSSNSVAKNAPINTRDAVYGGRTDGTKICHKARQGEEYHYVHLISVYPFFASISNFRSTACVPGNGVTLQLFGTRRDN